MDRNKTQLTHDVTTATIMWLDERGFKPTETEVPVRSEWVADLASVIHPTRGESTVLGLMPRKRKATDTIAWESLFQRLPKPLSVVIEVKTTRADFFKDRRKWLDFGLPADLCYIAMPRGMLTPGEWPVKWGVLSMHSDKTVAQLKTAMLAPVDLEQRMKVVLAIAVRRDHHTRYERFREQEKDNRNSRNATVNRERWSRTFQVAMAIARGGKDRYGYSPDFATLEEALESQRIRGLSRRMLADLENLWDVRGRLVELVASAGVGPADVLFDLLERMKKEN